MTARIVPLVLAALAGALVAQDLRTDPEPATVTVMGESTVRAQPQAVRITFLVQGQATEVEDAVVKFRDTRRRVQEALVQHGVPANRIQELTFQIGPALDPTQGIVMGMGDDSPQPPPEYLVTVAVRAEVSWGQQDDTVTMASRVGTIVQALTDLGIGTQVNQLAIMQGRPGVDLGVQLVYGNLQEVRARAAELALSDARQKAVALAAAAGRDLHYVLSMEESPDGAGPAGAFYPWWPGAVYGELSSISFELRTSVTVVYRLL